MKKVNVGISGITLISLVVTIIVLIILAGITINIILNIRMIKRAQEAADLHEVASIQERLELVKAPVQVDKWEITIDDYLAQADKENLNFEITQIDRVDEENAYITVNDKYVFLLEYEENGNLKITYQGKVKQLKPKSPKLEIVSGTLGLNGYYITDVEVRITGGIDNESGATKTTYILTGATTQEETEITSGQTITITNVGTTVIKAYTYDNASNKSIETILEIKRETTELQEANITISGATTRTSLPATLTAEVEHIVPESGIDINSCRYVLNNSNQPIETNASSYTGGNFTSNNQQIPLSLNSATSWYLHVLTVSNSGQVKETIKGPITVTANRHAHSGSSSAVGGCYVGTTTQCTGTIMVYGSSNASCDSCGKEYSNPGYSAGLTLGNCTNYIENISLACGKTAGTTIDSYSVSY